jgi:hypothetical protein
VLLALVVVLLHGLVTIGPTTPVCKAGVPCTKPAARVVLTFSRPGYAVVRTKTDAHGRYAVSLASGRWYVRSSAGMRIAPVSFVVPRLRTARRDFAIDTGIR